MKVLTKLLKKRATKKAAKRAKTKVAAKRAIRRAKRRGGEVIGEKGRRHGGDVTLTGLEIDDQTGNPGATVVHYTVYGPDFTLLKIDTLLETNTNSVSFPTALECGTVIVSATNPNCDPIGSLFSTKGEIVAPPFARNLLRLTLNTSGLFGGWAQGPAA